MRMIKVGDKYLALVDDQKSAMRFDQSLADTRIIALTVDPGARVVKLKPRVDGAHTSESIDGIRTLEPMID